MAQRCSWMNPNRSNSVVPAAICTPMGGSEWPRGRNIREAAKTHIHPYILLCAKRKQAHFKSLISVNTHSATKDSTAICEGVIASPPCRKLPARVCVYATTVTLAHTPWLRKRWQASSTLPQSSLLRGAASVASAVVESAILIHYTRPYLEFNDRRFKTLGTRIGLTHQGTHHRR